VAQLGARFHGMEEVVSSNLTRSTKTFQTLTANTQLEERPPESNWSPNAILTMGSQGHCVGFRFCPPVPSQTYSFKSLGGMGIVLLACCRLRKTTTSGFHTGTMFVAPTQ
jgi:hypothetical protein